ncbi:MAG TPA: flagella basal body P-ring formation protein FlgA [Terriglobales bacterium]
MNTVRKINDFTPGAGTSNRRLARSMRNHAGVLLALVLLVPLGASAVEPDREYVDRLAKHLARSLPGITADDINLPQRPKCPVENITVSSVGTNVFGTAVTLRCGEPNTLPVVAMLKTKLQRTSSKANPVAISRGCNVRLEILADGISISTTAHALTAGDVGQAIRVRTARTNRVLQAQVIDSFTVRAVLRGHE